MGTLLTSLLALQHYKTVLSILSAPPPLQLLPQRCHNCQHHRLPSTTPVPFLLHMTTPYVLTCVRVPCAISRLPFSLAAQIVDEVRERLTFLESMKALGRGGEYQSQIRGEVAGRLQELERLGLPTRTTGRTATDTATF